MVTDRKVRTVAQKQMALEARLPMHRCSILSLPRIPASKPCRSPGSTRGQKLPFGKAPESRHSADAFALEPMRFRVAKSRSAGRATDRASDTDRCRPTAVIERLRGGPNQAHKETRPTARRNAPVGSRGHAWAWIVVAEWPGAPILAPAACIEDHSKSDRFSERARLLDAALHFQPG